jgi:transitional endoplasmic reticulum ATPase
LGSERQATGPIPWVISQLGQFLGDGYREIRALISSNTPQNVKKLFSGSLLALIFALLAVAFIASQIHPVVIALAVACVLLIVYGRTLFQRLALFAGYFLCGFVLFIGAGLIVVVPVEKDYPLVAKVIAVLLFVVLCLVMPALLSIRPRPIAAGSGTAVPGAAEMKKTTLTFADIGGLADAKRQIRELVQANLDAGKFGPYGVFRNGILLHGPRGTGKTFLAEATAGEFGLRYLVVSAAGLHHKWVGETEQRIKSLFDEANANKPALLFIDD